MEHFKFFVIGGGSGGIASARRAAGYGIKVGIAESGKWGGTCVNVGCVPKKMMWLCSSIKEILNESQHYGFTINESSKFSWEKMKSRRDFTIERLNKIYETNILNSGIKRFKEHAKFLGHDGNSIKLQIGNELILADNVLIATGSTPTPIDVPGSNFCINSDDFFSLEKQPKRVAIIGAGYIAAELAGVFAGIGTDTHVFTRGSTILRRFDESISNNIQKEMRKYCTMYSDKIIKSINKNKENLLEINLTSGESISDFEKILVAIGRHACLKNIGLESIPQLKLNSTGHIQVDEFQNTSFKNIYALGDVCGQAELTPVAIAAGRRLADRLFGNVKDAKVEYDNIPTVIFTHPPIGTIGLTEAEAKDLYGDNNLKIYRASFVDLYYSAFDIQPENKPRTHIKLICLKHEKEKIIGLHIIGRGADEILQGFAVAIKMGATKSDFDRCIAIHPTAGEELVTLAPWGLSHQSEVP